MNIKRTKRKYRPDARADGIQTEGLNSIPPMQFSDSIQTPGAEFLDNSVPHAESWNDAYQEFFDNGKDEE